ncbi:MAG: hypothetical protein F6K24_38680 [Okeania sp. SIO2D1]|uniref:hypothetical protein n=1 Tax=Okeania sp. SIO2C9 TaxID=2607791 RepID=UPI0013B61988|nr:hypothetical protein [Okeania sp. SIO2C9]NEQ74698.1 hypothetical protein [Okeania sp. SIO2C9]NES70724.1 hypothetical protein [Okeania sp. SIO2D1]
MEGQQYEFEQSQNELILDLSNKMRFVSYFLITIGVLAGIIGLFSVNPGAIIQGVVQTLIGIWTLNAASSFKLIVDTEGNDIVNLMGALGELRKLYRLQYWLLIIALIFMAIALVVGIIAGFFNT